MIAVLLVALSLAAQLMLGWPLWPSWMASVLLPMVFVVGPPLRREERRWPHSAILLGLAWDLALEPVEPIPFDSPLGQPMRQALRGDSGSMIGLDYRGIEVLAAYEPLPRLGAVIVAKVDLSLVRAPFVRGAAIVIGLALVLVSLGALLFHVITGQPP